MSVETVSQALLRKPTPRILSGEHGGRSYWLAVCDTHVSNGHWMIAKSRIRPDALDSIIKGAALRGKLRRFSDARLMLRVVPPDDAPMWTVTEEARPLSKTLTARILRNGESEASIQEEYAQWLGIKAGDVMRGKSKTDPFATEVGDVVMPIAVFGE